jgi:ABC-type lipoprotein release transport system permease subunit
MGALALHTRAELRRRWRAWLGVAVLIGLVFGLVLASVAGARRTDTAFARMLEESRAWHVLVNPQQGTGSALRPEAVAALPGVEQIGTFMGMGVLHPGLDGEPDFAMSTIAPVEPGTLTEAFRPNVLEGRLFDPTRPDEALIGPAMAERLGIGPGDTIEAQYVDFEQLAAYDEAGGEGLPPTIPVRFTVVGVVVHPAEISADELFAAGYVSLTPAFWAQHEGEAFWFAVVVRLTDGPAGVPAFRRAVEQLVPDEAIEFQTIASVADAVGRGTRPVVVALLAFAAAVGAAGLVVCGQAVTRLVRFVDDPERYGWGWDVLVNLSLEGPEGDIAIRDRSITADLLAVEDLEVTAMAMDRVVVGGRPLPAIGMEQLRGGAGPAITAGRMPDGPDELALGSRTMAELGLAVGDTVPVGEGGSARELRVVGQVVFPGLGTYGGADRTELGVGVLLPTEALDQVGAGFDRPWIALRAPHDSAREATDAVLARHFERLGPERMEVLREPQRPSDVVNLGRVRATPLALTATLALLAAASLTHVLFSTIRWRRRDLAVLKALGFSRRQVRATVAWQATTVAVVALAVGLPLGAVGGRWAWSLLASALGVPAEPLLPLALLLVVPAVVLVANLAAAVPGRLAAGTPAAVVLRAE